MRRFYISRFPFLIFLILILSACTGFNQKPLQKQYYDLTLPLTSENPQDLNRGASLVVREFQIAAAFDSHQFIYLIQNDRYINDYYNEFISYPARLITEKLTDLITRTDRFSTSQNSDFRNTEFRLSGKINRLFGDYRDKNHPSAVLEIGLTLEKQINGKFDPVLSKNYAAKIPMVQSSPVQLTKAWSEALTRIAAQFIENTNQW